MNESKLSEKAQDLVELCREIHKAADQARAASKTVEVALRYSFYGTHKRAVENTYDEVITASNSLSSLSITTFRDAVAAVETDLLADQGSAGVLEKAAQRVKIEVLREHGEQISNEEARKMAAYQMAWDFVSMRSRIIPRGL
jgi:hypothetical protein